MLPAVRFRSATQPIWSLAEASDAAWIATGGEDGTIRCWPVGTGEQRSCLTDHCGPIRCAIGPDRTWIAASGQDGCVRVGDVAGAICRRTMAPDAPAAGSLVIALDGSCLATVNADQTVRVWDPVTGACIAVVRVDGEVRQCGWTPDGRRCAARAAPG